MILMKIRNAIDSPSLPRTPCGNAFLALSTSSLSFAYQSSPIFSTSSLIMSTISCSFQMGSLPRHEFMMCDGLRGFLMHLEPLCDRGKNLVSESRMICSADSRSWNLLPNITASSGINWVIRHRKSDCMVKVVFGSSNWALTTVARQLPSMLCTSLTLPERNARSVARRCVRCTSTLIVVSVG